MMPLSSGIPGAIVPAPLIGCCGGRSPSTPRCSVLQEALRSWAPSPG